MSAVSSQATREAPAVRRSAAERLAALDRLLDATHAELVPRYEAARAPALGSLRGPLRGRMLAVPMLRGQLARNVRLFAGSEAFPWRGKSFAPKSATRGEGINRVISDRIELFRFFTFVGPSRHDGRPALQLDYDHTGNPALIRLIEDEVRELEPGLWLGQAWLRWDREKHFVLWFALADAAP